MSVELLLTELSARGVRLSVEQGRLGVSAPKGGLSPELRQALTTYRDVILATIVKQQGGEPRAPALQADPANRHAPFSLTDIQRAYWIAHQEWVELGGRVTHFYTELEQAAFDLPRLNAAWRAVLERHDMLRAVVRSDGTQRVLPDPGEYVIAVDDWSGLDAAEQERRHAELAARMSHQVFDPERWPQFEIRVVRFSPQRSRLCFSISILMVDVGSLRLLFNEWATLYADPTARLAPLTITFRDYVVAAQTIETTPAYAKARTYWQERAATLPAGPELPLAVQPGALKRPRFQRRRGGLERETWTRLKERAQAFGLTPAGLLLAAFSEVLARFSAQDQFSLNLPLFNRVPLHPEVNRLVGDFTTLSLLAVDWSGPDFLARAIALQRRLWSDLEHRHFNGIRVMRERDAGHCGHASRTTVPIVFTSALSGEPDAGFEALGEEVAGITQTPQIWLDYQVFEHGGALRFNWDAIEVLFPAGMLDAMFAMHGAALERLADDAECWREVRITRLPAATEAILAAANHTRRPLDPKLLFEAFYDRATEGPRRSALVWSTGRLSYGELERGVNGLASRLRDQGVKPNTLIAVVMEKGWEQVVGALGITISGAAYLPIDASLPEGRIRHLLKRGQVTVALTQPHLQAQLAAIDSVQWITIDDDTIALGTAERPAVVNQPTDLAYVIYTSGSTGEPKGVCIDHRGAHTTISDVNARFGIGAEDRVLALSALGFDLSVYDIFGLLAVGGAIVVPDRELTREPAHWIDLVEKHDVTLWNSVPAFVQMLVEYAGDGPCAPLASLRQCWMSGDWIPLDLPNRLRALVPDIRPISMGGATEASIWSNYHEIEAIDPTWKSIPYGFPLSNQFFRVLDAHLQPRPIWVPGELYIGGDGLAQGYWRNDAITRERFIVHPITQERLYRTGDLGCYHPEGWIEFLGRADFQVKVDGFRIELGEIESVLTRIPALKAAVVSVVETATGADRLTAFVIPAGDRIDERALREHLQTRLPAYMIPALFVPLPQFPLTANGKVDRPALAAQVKAAPDAQTAPKTPPRTDTERSLVALVVEVLAIPAVGVEDNFFSLGCDSLLAVRLMAKLRAHFALELTVGALFEHPSVAKLAAHIDTLIWAARGQAPATADLEEGEL